MKKPCARDKHMTPTKSTLSESGESKVRVPKEARFKV